ncbi:MAG: FtsK/SpoIIIE domain-containing protein, partial [Thermomicrobiales bacterium]
ITAPLGVTGARKTQSLTFGVDTEHNALVVGRVGSGKSTLLHAAIMSLALTYSPEELELYLLDFKKGVEFRTYAVHKLPHARAIAVESEREFAQSILQKLHAEMNRRGELFRAATQQYGETPNIKTYRAKTGQPLPRIVLLVDEFQEFFTENDALASQARLLLEGMVRQGRGFGIHVMLCSQTLGGEHTLSKVTMDQTTIRIALQSSDADSRLILDDDNPAARLLDRPGEAIYNSKAGLVEGNNLFQTAWLTDEDRDVYLVKMTQLANERSPARQEPVIFEGSANADPSKNRELATLLEQSAATKSLHSASAWVGDPIAITDPTVAKLKKQGGNNLLIVGQDTEAAFGMLSTTLVGLARQHELANDNALIEIVDLSTDDMPHKDIFRTIAELFPDSIRFSGRRGLLNAVERLHKEVERRIEREEEESSLPPQYLFVVGLQRARDLREDDSYSYSSSSLSMEDDEPSISANKQFLKIAHDGPDVHVHIVTWVDTLANLNRILGRGLRDFDLRVAMQMSYNDSNTFIDTPAASKLGTNRALLFSEDAGTVEKFRPYGIPSSDWLGAVEHRPIPHDASIIQITDVRNERECAGGCFSSVVFAGLCVMTNPLCTTRQAPSGYSAQQTAQIPMKPQLPISAVYCPENPAATRKPNKAHKPQW